MHSANADKSKRLKRLLGFMRAHPKGATTAQIQAWCGGMATSTDISELRANGHLIPRPTSYVKNGRRVFTYVYRGKA